MNRNVSFTIVCIAAIFISWFAWKPKQVLQVPQNNEFRAAAGHGSTEHTNLTILATNDLHSTFNGLGLQSYPAKVLGGYSRLTHLISEIRSARSKAGEVVIVVDAGDWYSGSLYDNIAAHPNSPEVPQLEYFSYAKYDAIILGNHEFDRYEDALFIMLEKMNEKSLPLKIIASNLRPLPKESRFSKYIDNPHSAVSIIPYLVKDDPNKGKIGILGYTTPDALYVSHDYREDLQFVGFSSNKNYEMDELLELARNQAADLKTRMGCDMVIALIHGGHKDLEDDLFARIPHVDVVVGGHTHETYLYREPTSGSLISQCSYSGQYLTSLSVTKTEGGTLFRPVDDSYSQYVSKTAPQCIKVVSQFLQDPQFQQKITNWQGVIKDITKLDMNTVVMDGDLSDLYKNSESRETNAQLFSNMLLRQFNKMQPSGKDPALAFMWNMQFLETDQFIHDSRDIRLTYSDVYNLIFLTATKNIYSFYIKKRDIWWTLQGVFILQKMVSPLLSVCLGGVAYDETWYYGVPVISNMRTVDGIPYEDWPDLIRVVANSVTAPYFWKMGDFTFGMWENFARSKDGGLIDFQDSLIHDAPKEIDMFLDYLHSI